MDSVTLLRILKNHFQILSNYFYFFYSLNIKNHNLKWNRFKSEKSTEDLGNDANEINAKNEIKRVAFQSTDISSIEKFSKKKRI